jgi:hypothetical protein
MSLALGLDNRIVNRPLDAWVQEPNDVSARFVHFGDNFVAVQHLAQSDDNTESLLDTAATATSTIKSDPASMAPTLLHQSTNTHNNNNNPPSLRSCYTSATPTESSISTALASHFPAGVPLLEDNNGVLEIPVVALHSHAPVYECAFWFLNCAYISQNKDDWEIHVLSHFRGEEPPASVLCPLCEWAVTCETGSEAWALRMQHLAHEHTMRGQTLRTSRPDFALFEYLWRVRLIDAADLKELKGGNHNLMHPPGNFVEMNARAGSGRDARRHRPGTQHARVPRALEPRRY